LVDGKGNPSLAKLSLRILEDSSSAVAGNALEQVQMSKEKLPQPLISEMSGASTTSDTLSNQQNLVTSFSSLMKKFEPLVKIGDEVAKVRSLIFSFIDDLN
jgi:hypothetical protein